MTAASSPPPRDGEVCGAWAPKVWMQPQEFCDQPKGHPPLALRDVPFEHRYRGVHWNGDRRPAAPSEPPAADSPTPGTETCKCGHRRDGHQPPMGCRLCACAGRFTPAAPVTTEPPAETQQGDERDEDGLTATDRMVARLIWDGFRSQLTDKAIARGAMDGFEPRTMAQQIVAALAARPSADTDRLLASVLRKLMGADSFLALDTHRSATGMPVQFTLDDTTVEVTDAEADAIKATVGW